MILFIKLISLNCMRFFLVGFSMISDCIASQQSKYLFRGRAR